MRPSVSADFPLLQNKEPEHQHNISGNLFFKVIENAGGVPYQLVFGQMTGEGYYQHAGENINKLFGISTLHFTEKLFIDLIEDYKPVGKNITGNYFEVREEIMNHQLNEYKAEILIKTPAGDEKWIMDSSIAITDDKTGEVTGLAGIYFDITEQKNVQKQLVIARERATDSDRLKTAFLNNLSHEIRTPLNAIVGFTTLLGEPGMMHRRREFMEIITHSSDHLLEIVDDIVEISKIKTGIVRLILKKTDINEMILRVCNRFKPSAAAKNILFNCYAHMDERHVVITTDGYKLFQTIIKLVHNAIKFTQEGGAVEFGFDIKDDKIQFYVSDTGIGIGIEHQPHIFNPFYQAESSNTHRFEGTGLGLSIAKAYVELLGGKIWFTSVPGQGSVFGFFIPDPNQYDKSDLM